MHCPSTLRLIIKLSLLIYCFSTYCIHAYDLPSKPSGPVADYADVFDNATRLKINSIARTLWVENKFGLIVATVPDIGTATAEQYAAALYQSWGAGRKTSPENALVLISIKPRVACIHVGGGARGYLSVLSANRLLEQYGMADFRGGEFNRGILLLTQELSASVINKRGDSEASSAPNWWQSAVKKNVAYPVRSGGIAIAGLAFLVVVIIGGVSWCNRRRRPDYCGSAFGGGVRGGEFGALIRHGNLNSSADSRRYA